MTTADYQALLPSLPELPGIYRFIGTDEEILYIGKAKSLKKRIASYFGEKKRYAPKDPNDGAICNNS